MDGRGCIEVRETEVVNLWCTVGASEDLATDADVTRFLLALYFADNTDGKKKHAVRCAVCKASLTPLCYTCRSGLQQPKQSVVTKTSAKHKELVRRKTQVISISGKDAEAGGTSSSNFQSAQTHDRHAKKSVPSSTTASSRPSLRSGKFTSQSANLNVTVSGDKTEKQSSDTFTAQDAESDDQDAGWNTFGDSGDDDDASHTDIATTDELRKGKHSLVNQQSSTKVNASNVHSVKANVKSKPHVTLTRCDDVPPAKRKQKILNSAPEELQTAENKRPFAFRLYKAMSVSTDFLNQADQDKVRLARGQQLLFARQQAGSGTVEDFWAGRFIFKTGGYQCRKSHFVCRKCNTVFETDAEANRHRRPGKNLCHEDPTREMDAESKEILARVWEECGHLRCHDCNLIFSRETFLKNHLKTHETPAVDPLDIVNKARETINRRLREKFDKTMGFTTGKYPMVGQGPALSGKHIYYDNYSCSLCHKVFDDKDKLIQHMTRPTCEGEDPPVTKAKRERFVFPVLCKDVKGKRKSAQAVKNYSEMFTDDPAPDPDDLVAISKNKASETCTSDDADTSTLIPDEVKSVSLSLSAECQDSSVEVESGVGSMTNVSIAEFEETASEFEESSGIQQSSEVETESGIFKKTKKARDSKTVKRSIPKSVSSRRKKFKTDDSEDKDFDPNCTNNVKLLSNDFKVPRLKSQRFMNYYKYELSKGNELTLTEFMTGKRRFNRLEGPYAGKKSHFHCFRCNTVFPAHMRAQYESHRNGRPQNPCPSFKGVPPKEELDAESVEILKQAVDELLHCCPLCDRVFVTDLAYKDHLLEHTRCESDSVYKCKFCNKTFPTADGIWQHLAVPKGNKCQTCGEKFLVGCQLKSHLAIHPPAKPDAKKCKHCDEMVPIKHMKQHKKTAHNKRPKVCHLCNVCGKEWDCLSNLQAHMITHSDERPYVCSCGKRFKHQHVLDKHQLVHKEKTEECSYCTAKFKDPVSLRQHVRNQHILDRRYQCTVCKRKYVSQSYLTKHMKFHMKSVCCSFCHVSFTNTASLRVHMTVHTGEKPFHCSYCPSKFGRRDYLIKHERLHTGHMPYSCSDCKKKFREYSSYKLHREKQHPKSFFSCDQCGLRFPVINSLNHHKKFVHALLDPGVPQGVSDEAVAPISENQNDENLFEIEFGLSAKNEPFFS